MTYWLAFPLALFMLSPLWLKGWSGTYVGDTFQVSEGAWSADGINEGTVGPPRNEGTVGPPRNEGTVGPPRN